MSTDGLLVVDKPRGPTSHDVVDRVRRIFLQRKVGHTGTLDPLATGVLPLLLGRATKLSQWLVGTDKGYRADVVLGEETATLDAEGEVLRSAPVTATRAEIDDALLAFRGEIEQVPPMFSAKRQGGRRLHELARRGIEVSRDPVTVRIHELEVVRFEAPRLVLDVQCSSGTYVRVLAADLGTRLGCGAHLAGLRRTRVGPFTLEEATPLEALEADPALAHRRVLPLATAASIVARLRDAKADDA